MTNTNGCDDDKAAVSAQEIVEEATVLETAKDTLLPTTSTTSSASPAATLPMSKNQFKKLQKKERTRQKQQDKKRREKEERRAKAIADGRDLEAERAFQEERTLAGDRQRRLQEAWAQKLQQAANQFQICIDCAFEEQMREREIASLAQQIRYCYAYNKKSPNPSRVAVTSLKAGSETRLLLEKEMGFGTWHQRAFTCTDQELLDYYATDNNHTSNEGTATLQPAPKLVYLTSDSTTVLKHLDDDTVYVIGGIVDRNRLKTVAMHRANALGIPTAKLPLDEYLAQMPSTRVLTCNHVFDILLQYREHGNDWVLALQNVLPRRKGAELKEKCTGVEEKVVGL